MTYEYFYQTSLGEIKITERNNHIIGTGFRKISEEAIREETPLIREVYTQLTEYLAGDRSVFDIPLKPEGTPFQLKVWNILASIPYGTTTSYRHVAEITGNAGAARAVGMAVHHNPALILIPCHRVIGIKGDLTGFAAGLEIKKKLLDLEKAHILPER
ncbi:MAG: methylated-DNA--[protein]-cysteine S-methyltransferase [Bacteroidales bacterium]|nr:methylated-DNA--[protein]-cysteine S-methyltransferase [Bacteroidales bacterium]